MQHDLGKTCWTPLPHEIPLNMPYLHMFVIMFLLVSLATCVF
ncbi:MAG: hypothetical protein ACTSX7_15555 [Alphaproteobacteria bacterium]